MSDQPTMQSPTPKQSNPLMKVLIAVLVIVALAGGAGAWWIMRIGHEEKAVAQAFLAALQAGNATQAKTYCTSDVDGNVEFFAKHLPTWGPAPDYDGLVAMKRTNRTEISGRLEWGTQTVKTFGATVVKEGESHKIKAFNFQ